MVMLFMYKYISIYIYIYFFKNKLLRVHEQRFQKKIYNEKKLPDTSTELPIQYRNTDHKITKKSYITVG